MSALEIRACQDEEEQRLFRWLVRYVFANNKQDEADLEGQGIQPAWTNCGFIDGRVVTTMAALPFRVKLNGQTVRMAGVTCVGTSPAHRRMGIMRKVMTNSLARWRDEGNAFAILWASMGSIYQRFGYGLASTHVKYSFDPAAIAFSRDIPTPGSIEHGDAGGMFDTLREVFDRASADRNLVIQRSRALWNAEPLQRKDGGPVFAALYRDADGVPQGYVIYRQRDVPQDDAGRGIEIDIRDLWWTTIEAYRAVWQFVLGHDLANRVSLDGVVPEDDPLPHLVLEQRLLHRRTSDGIWLRLLDVREALGQRAYGDSGALTIAVEGDDICPWNNGVHTIEAAEGGHAVSPGGGAPAITTSPNGLASLIAGHASASQLSRWGMLESADTASLVKADRWFATRHRPHGPDHF